MNNLLLSRLLLWVNQGCLRVAFAPIFTPATATVVDDMPLKMTLADAAMRGRTLTKGDVGNAYSKGARTRAPGYMALPSTLPVSADGRGTGSEVRWQGYCAKSELIDAKGSGGRRGARCFAFSLISAAVTSICSEVSASDDRNPPGTYPHPPRHRLRSQVARVVCKVGTNRCHGFRRS